MQNPKRTENLENITFYIKNGEEKRIRKLGKRQCRGL
jgi:hypothetical protein